MSKRDFLVEMEYSDRVRCQGLATVVYGINPIPGQLDNTVKTLLETNDVAIYNINAGVLLDGEPERLPNLIDAIYVDVADKLSDYRHVRAAGASLGAFVAYHVIGKLQKEWEEKPIMPALYAAAGVNLAQNLFHHIIYRGARKNYEYNNFNESKLAEAWKDIDITPENDPGPEFAAVGVITRLDQYSLYHRAVPNLLRWQENGARLDLIRTWKFGHTAVIDYFASITPELLERAKKIDVN